MPQMAPISWLVLFIVFSISFIIFNMVNYYNKNFNSKSEKTLNNNSLNNKNNLNWKW